MKTLNLLLVLLFTAVSGIAQINFKQVPPPAPAPQIIPVFESVEKGDIAYADVDGYNGLDVIITGSNSNGDPITKLYINDGNGNYTEKTGTPFFGVTESSVAFADVDGNGTQDLLITGFDGTNPISKLYINDGNGNFTDSGISSIIGVRESDIAFADLDGGNGPDVLVTGRTGAGSLTSILYINDGSGNFSQVAAANIAEFADVNRGAIAFADVDGNGTKDVVITGNSAASGNPPVTEIYLNDGNADFTKLTGSTFVNVRDGDVAFADVDGNGSQDLLISGYNSSSQPITKLYTNDGNSNPTFTEASVPFDALGFSSIAIANIDAVNGLDVLITGVNSVGQPISKLYTNDGAGTFTLAGGTPFKNISRGSVLFLDLNGNAILDLVISGQKTSPIAPITEIYVNDGSGNFTLATGTPFPGVRVGASAFADFDLNGTKDVVITGRDDNNKTLAKLYSNDGNGNFSEVTSTSFAGVGNSAVAFADVDGANGPDVLISGVTTPVDPNPFQYRTLLYKNNGDGTYMAGINPFDESLSNGSIAYADILEDGNGDLDIVITGIDNFSVPFTQLYTNNGSGAFTLDVSTSFPDVFNSSIAFADMDGQNGPDLIISGQTSTGSTTELYLNNGSGSFAASTETFEALRNSSISVDDLGGNSSLDLLITGTNTAGDPVTKLYINDGTGSFTDTANPFEAVDNGSVAIADIDGVNGNDVIISGENIAGEYITKLYINDGSGTFSEETDLPFQGVFESDLSLSDVDGDGLIDVLITGRNNSGFNISVLYRNTTDFVDPSITSATTASVNENDNSSFYTATADEDVTFSLGDSKDEASLRISNGELFFLNGADFENPLDANTDNVYLVDIIATDEGGNTVTQEVTITVNDVDDTAPVITSATTLSVQENTSGSIYTATADESVTFSLGSSKDEALFTLSTDAISFTSAPDFETPQDADANNVYLIDLTAEDSNGNTSTVQVSITVTDVAESGPTITSPASVTVAENVTGTVYTATADAAATFTLGNSKDEALFSISTDAISFNNAPDFEAPADGNTDNVYQLDLIADDGGGNMTTKAISITVTDVDETGPAITSPATVSVEENVTGTVYTATADVTATFTLGTSKDEALFTISTDAISFNNAPDFESPTDGNTDNVYELNLIATDANGFTSTKPISITVTDVDEAGPVITSPASATVEENVTGTVYTATADVTATFTLGTSKDEALFTISTDAISFNNAPDFETPADADTDNVYELDLVATDADGFATTKAISITVTDVDELGPVITSPATASVEENVTGTVYTATADVTATFSLGSSKDEALFSISTDAISFNNPPDFETPADANTDNVYALDLIATDADGLSTTKAISITVTDVDELGPVITSPAAASVEENVTGTVYTATADVTATFSLGTNKDEALFSISIDAISFNNAPDFEAPADGNTDNIYQLDLIATDADGFATTKAVSITVTDVEEEPLAVEDEILSKIYPNPVQHTLFIQPVNMARDASIHIMDMTGKIHKTLSYQGQELEVEVSDLASGIYLLKVNSNGKQMHLKFIKE